MMNAATETLADPHSHIYFEKYIETTAGKFKWLECFCGDQQPCSQARIMDRMRTCDWACHGRTSLICSSCIQWKQKDA